MNVLKNGSRYFKENSVIQISATGGEKEGTLMIRDEGIGVAAKDLIYITDRFYRVNKARSSSDSGIDLEVAIVKEIIDAHQGQLLFNSRLGEGTTIKIVLPNFIM